MQTYDFDAARQYFAARMGFSTRPFELSGKLERAAPVHVVDVRDADSFHRGHVPGAVNLPRAAWAAALETGAGLRRDRPNIVYCYHQTCHLAAEAALEFARHGYPVVEMEGGFAAWSAQRLAAEAEAGSDVREAGITPEAKAGPGTAMPDASATDAIACAC